MSDVKKEGSSQSSKVLETAKSKVVKESYHLKSDSRTGQFATKPGGSSKLVTVKR